MPVLVEYALPLCKGHGTLLAWKGKDGPAETSAAANALAELGGKVTGIRSMNDLSPPLPPDRHRPGQADRRRPRTESPAAGADDRLRDTDRAFEPLGA